MKNAVSFTFAAFLLCIPVAISAQADEAVVSADYRSETPLMVIRFNQIHVDYPVPLYDTISRALKIKPGAVFDVVSIAPRAHESRNQDYYNTIAAQNSHKVLRTLHEIGLPADRISLVNAVDNVGTSEVRIYVH